MERFFVLVMLLFLPATLSFTRALDQRCRGCSNVEFQLFEAEIRGDPVREASGIRPSLHPLTINIISEALKVRARNDDAIPLRLSATIEPLQVAIAAGKLASNAIQKRQDSSGSDGMKLTVEEQQIVAGRVVGVVMRFTELEGTLHKKCQAASWIAKYGEWDSFGVLPDETSDVDERLLSDPLFTMNRAECLLALFLGEVEAPELARKNATVSDNSKVDFLDADRLEVLLGS
jgi:hypothetical protein